MANTPLVAPRVPLVDPKTGVIAREWFLFLMNQKTLAGNAAPLGHTHPESDITGLLADLADKAPLVHTHSEYEPVLGYTPVNQAGDTMLGPLTLVGDPTDNLQAATKQYVDAAETAAKAYADSVAVAGSFTAAKIVTAPSGSTFEVVFTDAGDVVAVD